MTDHFPSKFHRKFHPQNFIPPIFQNFIHQMNNGQWLQRKEMSLDKPLNKECHNKSSNPCNHTYIQTAIASFFTAKILISDPHLLRTTESYNQFCEVTWTMSCCSILWLVSAHIAVYRTKRTACTLNEREKIHGKLVAYVLLSITRKPTSSRTALRCEIV